MRKDVRHYFESNLRLSGQELILLFEQAICEGVYSGGSSLPESPAHLFGRTCALLPAGRFPALAGMAASGIRTAAILDAQTPVQAFSRQHLPAVFHVRELPQPAPDGCFQVVATNMQEAIDWTLMAHKIAELALVPGLVVCRMEGQQTATLLHDSQIREFLGDIDDWIPSPTPAQHILFGKNRRRLPNWFHFDLAGLLGSGKDASSKNLEAAARERFFFRHLPELIGVVTREFSSFSGRSYSPIQSHQMKDAEYVILVQGPDYRHAVEAVDQLRKEKVRAGCFHLNIIDPFPEAELTALLSGKKALTVLEPVNGERVGESRLFSRIRTAAGLAGKGAPAIYSGQGTSSFSRESIIAAIRNMAPKGAQKKNFYLDIDFTRSSSAVAQHEVLLHAISREYPGVESESLPTGATGKDPGTGQPSLLSLPESVRRHKDQGPPYSKVSRFYHDTAALYGSGHTGELVADPFQSLPVIPPETALFANLSATREQLPLLDAERCTGCGACFVQCPHAALPPLSINLENLIKGGMEIASGQGRTVAPLTPLVKNLARFSATELNSVGSRSAKVSDFLPAAFEKLAGQMKLEGEKLENARQGIHHLVEVLADFQGIRTETFYDASESLFALTVNPHSCTACGVCVEVCPEEALSMAPQTAGLLEQYAGQFQLWEQLPDTDSGTIERLNRDPQYDPFASVLLSRYFYQSMSGGSSTEEGAPAKTLLHLITALTESAVQPDTLDWIKELDGLIGQLSENIQGKLSTALPSEDSAALRNALMEAKGKRVPLDELVSRMGVEQRLQSIDTALLQRKIALESNLKDMRWALADGPNGTGRARYGLVFYTPNLPWLNDYPFQPFNVPVLVNPKDGGMGQVFGLIQAQIRYLLDQVRLVRRARLEHRDAYRPEIHDQQIAALSWADLDDKEKRLLRPLLVVADAKGLSQSDHADIRQLLASEWPVKVVLLNDGLVDPASPVSGGAAAANGLLLSAITLRKPIVVQGSLGAARPLYKGLMKGLQSRAGALFHILAPRSEQYIIPVSKWLELCRIALESRAFPSVLFEPHAEQAYLSQGFSLEGNPEVAAPFMTWLQTQRSWNGEELPGAAQQAEQAAMQQWKTWQELSGIISAFPEALRSKTEATLRKQFEAELEAVKAQYEAQLQEQQAAKTEQVRVQLREKLLMLSKK
ncbi:MAG: 4Fe-4S binding protein [Lewinellaceae bacterium]|nr:4Fe-4S binding protein [Lewinellaceae bacterium]